MVDVQTNSQGQPIFMRHSKWPFTRESIAARVQKSRLRPAGLVFDGLGWLTAVLGLVVLPVGWHPPLLRLQQLRPPPLRPSAAHLKEPRFSKRTVVEQARRFSAVDHVSRRSNGRLKRLSGPLSLMIR
jgi:hypothetical protein